MDRSATIATLRECFAERRDVIAAWLFGSVARDDAGGDSDVDVAVLFRERPAARLDGPVFALETEIERRVGTRTQLVSMADAPPDLVHRIMRDGVLVADHDPGARIRFEVWARNEFFDSEYLRRVYRRAASKA